MINNYLILISRNDYNLLFKYGYFRVNGDMVVSFSCSYEELPQRKDLAQKLFEGANPFTQMDAVLILHYSKKVENTQVPVFDLINIEDVEHIIPLTDQAKAEFKESFNHIVRIEEPIWESEVISLRVQQRKQDIILGIRNAAKIFGVDNKIENAKNNILENTIDSVAQLWCNGGCPGKEDTIWTYLLRYERHDLFPKDAPVGYFMDAITVFCNFLSKTQKNAYDSDICETAIFKYLETLDVKASILDILSSIEKEEKCAKFLNIVHTTCPSSFFLKVAVLFLVYKDKLSNGESIEKMTKWLSYYGDDVEYAIALLGIFQGHEKTSNLYYELSELKFVKDKQTLAFERSLHQQKIDEANAEIERRQREREQEDWWRKEDQGKSGKGKSGKGATKGSGRGKNKSGYDKKGEYNPFRSSPYGNGKGFGDETIEKNGHILHRIKKGEEIVQKDGKYVPSSMVMNSGNPDKDKNSRTIIYSSQEELPSAINGESVKVPNASETSLPKDGTFEESQPGSTSANDSLKSSLEPSSEKEEKVFVPNKQSSDTLLFGEEDRYPLKMSKSLTAKNRPNLKSGQYRVAHNEEEFIRLQNEGFIYF